MSGRVTLADFASTSRNLLGRFCGDWTVVSSAELANLRKLVARYEAESNEKDSK